MQWSLLQPLSAQDCRDVLRLARRRRFSRGEVVFHEGDPANALHLVEKGHLAIRNTTPLGDVVTVRLVGPGDHFGEMALVIPDARSSTVLALDACETLSLHADTVSDLRQQYHGIETMLMVGLAKEVRRLSQALVEALHVPADKRVLRRLLDGVAVFGNGATADGTVTVPLTQDDIAQLAGTTRPTTNRVLRAAQEAGTIRIGRGRIEVIDPTVLRRRAN